MDAVVQLIRNGLCCIKDLELLRTTGLWDSTYVMQYYDFPEPMNKTTPLEVMIGLCQFYVVVTASRSGFNMMLSSYGKYKRIERLLSTRTSAKNAPDRIVNASLIKEGHFALRSLFIGALLCFIGVSFFWLFANSFHVTETDWIGGVQGLIHALSVSEVCLLPLLWFMWKDGREQLNKAQRMKHLAKEMKDSGKVTADDVDLSSLEALTGWLPFWDAGVGPFEPAPKNEDKLMSKETASIQRALDDILGSDKKDDKDEKARKAKLRDTAEQLLEKARITRLEGYREFLYLVLNAIAFYGYLVAIIVFYYDNEETQPYWIRQYALANFTNEDADWHGNFIGDFMWTIEPMVILGSPRFLKPRTSTEKKIKSE